MNDQFRAMCAELVAAVDDATESVDRTSDCVNVANYPELWAECMELIRKHDGLLTRARALLAQPVAEGPADKELVDHVGWFADEACLENSSGDIADSCRELIARWGRPTPQPAATSERLPGPEDCDEQGRCWLLTVEDEYPQWRLHSIEGAQPGGAMIWVPVDSSPGVMVDCFYTSHWLPANALPTPEAND